MLLISMNRLLIISFLISPFLKNVRYIWMKTQLVLICLLRPMGGTVHFLVWYNRCGAAPSLFGVWGMNLTGGLFLHIAYLTLHMVQIN